jgi:hypothetical protein
MSAQIFPSERVGSFLGTICHAAGGVPTGSERPDAGLLRYLRPSAPTRPAKSMAGAGRWDHRLSDRGTGTQDDFDRQYLAQLRVPQFGGRRLVSEVARSLGVHLTNQ